MSGIRSSLDRFQPSDPADQAELARLARKAWQERGVVLVRPADLDSEWLARGIIAWANEQYGERRPT